MHPSHPLFPLIIYVIAFLSAWLIRLKFKEEVVDRRFETIDGLRGFLALGVFIHHTAIWRQYIRTDQWQAPSTRLLMHFGQLSVVFFFMITSFLFVTKLLRAKETGFNWRAFFISRFFRIAPMYYVSLLIIFVFVMSTTHWQLAVPIRELLASLLNWGAFTIYQTPLINGYWVVMINAGVEWTLPFEWLFYFSLPLIGLFILKVKPKVMYLLIAAAFSLFFLFLYKEDLYFLYAFIGGGIAPFLIKYHRLVKLAQGPYAGVLILVCLVVISRFTSERTLACMLLVTLVFTLIAMGNSLFGILKNPTVKFLGAICYSTYLLHGLLLFAVFNLGLGMDVSKNLADSAYSFIIFCLTPVLVALSFLGFKYVELPFISRAKKTNGRRKATAA